MKLLKLTLLCCSCPLLSFAQQNKQSIAGSYSCCYDTDTKQTHTLTLKTIDSKTTGVYRGFMYAYGDIVFYESFIDSIRFFDKRFGFELKNIRLSLTPFTNSNPMAAVDTATQQKLVKKYFADNGGLYFHLGASFIGEEKNGELVFDKIAGYIVGSSAEKIVFTKVIKQKE